MLGCGKSPQSSKPSIWKKGQGYQAMPEAVTHQGRTSAKHILEYNSFFLEIMDLKKNLRHLKKTQLMGGMKKNRIKIFKERPDESIMEIYQRRCNTFCRQGEKALPGPWLTSL